MTEQKAVNVGELATRKWNDFFEFLRGFIKCVGIEAAERMPEIGLTTWRHLLG